jgi:hypothetical protein
MVSRILWAWTGIKLAMTAMRMGRLNCCIKTDLLGGLIGLYEFDFTPSMAGALPLCGGYVPQ